MDIQLLDTHRPENSNSALDLVAIPLCPTTTHLVIITQITMGHLDREMEPIMAHLIVTTQTMEVQEDRPPPRLQLLYLKVCSMLPEG